jgi:hypothetical protein
VRPVGQSGMLNAVLTVYLRISV